MTPMPEREHRDSGGTFCPPWPRIVGVVSHPGTWSLLRNGECDLVELRLDALDKTMRDLPLLVPCPLPLLLTFRHISEGGCDGKVSEEDRVRCVRALLKAAIAIDWELARLDSARELLQEAHACGVSCIGSAHFWDKTPDDALLCALEEKALAAGVTVLKVAFTPQNRADIHRGLAWLTETKHALPIALMGMGKLAGESRALYAENGSCLLYGYLGETATAPGQWSVAECRRLLNR